MNIEPCNMCGEVECVCELLQAKIQIGAWCTRGACDECGKPIPDGTLSFISDLIESPDDILKSFCLESCYAKSKGDA